MSVFAGTSLSQTGQAIEIIAMTMGVYLLISLVTSAVMSVYGWRVSRSLGRMIDITSSAFIRQDLVAERPAPVKTTGFIGLVRTRLFNSPTNILLTILGALLLWFTIVPSVRFLMVDAVWTGKDRTACLTENAGFAVGACWPYIQAKLPQLIYGFYPEAERWRVNLTLVAGGGPVVAAAHSAAAGERAQRRPVLLRLSGGRILPAARRRPCRLRPELDGRPAAIVR